MVASGSPYPQQEPIVKQPPQADTLSSQQQTAETCATLKLEAKRQLGDRTRVSPKDFEKLNIHTSSLQNGGVALELMDG